VFAPSEQVQEGYSEKWAVQYLQHTILNPNSVSPLQMKTGNEKMNRTDIAIEYNNYAVDELRQGNIRKAYSLLRESCENVYQQQQEGADQHSSRHHAINSPPEVYHFGWIDCTEPITRQLHKDEVFSTRSQDTSSTTFMYFKLLSIVDTPPVSGRPHHAGLGNPTCPCGFAWAIWYK
jgi:hypothetical protein